LLSRLARPGANKPSGNSPFSETLRLPHGSSFTFVSEAALADGLARKLKVQRSLVAVENTRGRIGKKSMIHNDATPKIEIDPETYDVRSDGELLVCGPADKLPVALFVLICCPTTKDGLGLDRQPASREPNDG
jgi:urease alpha subunit